MPQNWETQNKNGDAIPEIRIIANGATGGEKVHLYNILKGVYGTPIITGGTESVRAGEAEDIIISFSKSSSNFGLAKNDTIDGIKITPTWRPNDSYESTVSNYADWELDRWLEFGDLFFLFDKGSIWVNQQEAQDGSIEYIKDSFPAFVRNLIFNFSESDWNRVKDLNPEVVIKRWSSAKVRGSGEPVTSSGFKKPIAERVSVVPLTSANSKVTFDVEEYFRLQKKEWNIRAKGKNRSRAKRAEVVFEMTFRTTFNNVISEAKPIIIKAIAQTGGGIDYDQETGDPIDKRYVIISYTRSF